MCKILHTKALEFPNHLNIEDFKASNGWLGSWRSRYAVKFSKLSSDSANVNLQSVSEFKAKLAECCAGDDVGDIFNCDESCKGKANSKEKLKPLVIGKAARLCFEHIDPATLPVTWTGNKKAWITTVLFCAWLKELNKTMHTRKRNILLLLENATSHCTEQCANAASASKHYQLFTACGAGHYSECETALPYAYNEQLGSKD